MVFEFLNKSTLQTLPYTVDTLTSICETIITSSREHDKHLYFCLLDLLSAFDCVNHSLLLQRLEHTFGFSGMVLRWLMSYITSRSQQVAYCDQLSLTQSVQFGVLQGSVLGPLLFVLYTVDLSRVVANHGLILHQYADDCQIYTNTPVDDGAAAIDQFFRCLDDVEAWMNSSRLRLNPAKTQVLWLGSKYQLLKLNIQDVPVLSTSVRVVDSACDLGVVIESGLTMSDHVTAVCRSAYYQLRQLRTIACSLSGDAKKMLIQSFLSCRLDYCNALLYGISGGLIQRLQSVQNMAARLVTGARRRDHITSVLRQLHWLPVKQRIDFKLTVMVYKLSLIHI